MLSALIVRSQYHQQLEHLPAGCFGTAQSIMLQDGKITALYEFAYGFQPGELGPTGRRQPPFCFRLSFLDRPSPAAAGQARMLLAEAIAAVGNLDCVCDRVSVVTIFRTMLRKIFDGAGRNPMSEKNGWINVKANPALTGALAAFANYGATVGQSVAAVAAAREGGHPIVYDANGDEAAAPYQTRRLNGCASGVGASGDGAAGAANAAADAAAGAAAANATAGAGAALGGELQIPSLECHTEGDSVAGPGHAAGLVGLVAIDWSRGRWRRICVRSTPYPAWPA